MSLPSSNTVDELFRDALLPAAEAEAPDMAWEAVVRRIQATPTRVDQAHAVVDRSSVWPALREYVKAWVSRLSWTPVLAVSYWRRLGTWVHGAHTLYPPSTNDLDNVGPYGHFRPSAFAGVATKQVLDLRLAS